MSDTSQPPSVSVPQPVVERNRGQILVESYRLARISQRPALRTELHQNRAALREGRAARIAVGRKLPPPSHDVPSAPHDEITTAVVGQTAASAADIGASIFASFCGAMDATPPAIASSLGVVPECVEDQTASCDGGEHYSPSAALPLSTIGFGPGMTMRMGQLGIETVSDLAATDPAWLRDALGEISQLVNVDLWIATACKVAKREPASQ